MKHVGLLLLVLVLLLAGCIAQETEQETVSDEITPIGDFFVLDLGVQPEINIEEWRLEVTGLVENPLSLTYDEILAMPQVTQITYLYCMPGYEGTGEWTGVPLLYVLEKAGYSDETVSVVFHAADEYSSSIPLEKALLEDTNLAYKMNGMTLPEEHGYPLRLVVPDKVGYKWVKWVVKIELVDYLHEGYWESRGYSNIGNAPNAKSK